MRKSPAKLLMIAVACMFIALAVGSVPAAAFAWACPGARAEPGAASIAGQSLRASAGFAFGALGRFAPSLAP